MGSGGRGSSSRTQRPASGRGGGAGLGREPGGLGGGGLGEGGLPRAEDDAPLAVVRRRLRVELHVAEGVPGVQERGLEAGVLQGVSQGVVRASVHLVDPDLGCGVDLQGELEGAGSREEAAMEALGRIVVQDEGMPAGRRELARVDGSVGEQRSLVAQPQAQEVAGERSLSDLEPEPELQLAAEMLRGGGEPEGRALSDGEGEAELVVPATGSRGGGEDGHGAGPVVVGAGEPPESDRGAMEVLPELAPLLEVAVGDGKGWVQALGQHERGEERKQRSGS